jgi:hypothetical protein
VYKYNQVLKSFVSCLDTPVCMYVPEVVECLYTSRDINEAKLRLDSCVTRLLNKLFVDTKNILDY